MLWGILGIYYPQYESTLSYIYHKSITLTKSGGYSSLEQINPRGIVFLGGGYSALEETIPRGLFYPRVK